MIASPPCAPSAPGSAGPSRSASVGAAAPCAAALVVHSDEAANAASDAENRMGRPPPVCEVRMGSPPLLHFFHDETELVGRMLRMRRVCECSYGRWQYSLK